MTHTRTVHTIQRFRQEIREKVVYAMEMQAGAGSPTLSHINSLTPAWYLPDAATSNIRGNLKVPNDRVPGTPIDMKIVWTVLNQNVGNVFLKVSYNVTGSGDLFTLPQVPPGFVDSVPAYFCEKTSGPLRIHESRLDGRQPNVDINFVIEREGAHALDTYNNNVQILKIVFEYTAFV
jgi:hypothetical protein